MEVELSGISDFPPRGPQKILLPRSSAIFSLTNQRQGGKILNFLSKKCCFACFLCGIASTSNQNVAGEKIVKN